MKSVIMAAMLVAATSTGLFVLKGTKGSNNTSETIIIQTLKSSPSTNQLNSNNNEQSYSAPTEGVTLKEISKQRINKKRVVYFNNVVDYTSVALTLSELKRLEAQSNDPIYLLIDSPGGSVVDGGLLVSQIEASKAPVYTVCTRLCASMAAMLHSYGKKRYSLDRAILMYHPASAGVQGQLPNMINLLTTIQNYVNKMNANVVSRSKISKDQFEKLVAYELWADADESLKLGLIDGIINLDVDSVPSDLLHDFPGERYNRSNEHNSDFEWISPRANQFWKHLYK